MGQHSKNTNRISTGAKVALSGLAITASGIAVAPSASAAPDSDWDRLAQCESGGNWGINTGNGFQGGLQFAPSTWSAYGGTEYAATANQATREQQITVGERVLAEQGWTAWPACSAQLGLSSAPSQRDNAYANGAQAAVQPAAAPVEEAAPAENAAPTAQAPAEAADCKRLRRGHCPGYEDLRRRGEELPPVTQRCISNALYNEHPSGNTIIGGYLPRGLFYVARLWEPGIRHA